MHGYGYANMLKKVSSWGDIEANDLYYTNKVNDLKKEIEYESILDDCLRIIVKEYSKSKSGIVFEVPKFRRQVEGYDLADCVCFMILSLRKKGFYVRYTQPNYLFIGIKDINKEKERVKKMKFLCYEHLKTCNLLNESKTLMIEYDDNKMKNRDELTSNKEISNISINRTKKQKKKIKVTRYQRN